MAPSKTSPKSPSSPSVAHKTFVDRAAPVGTAGASKVQYLRSGDKKEYSVIVPPATLTMRDIQSQIPKQYFERSAWKSSCYVLRDLVQVAVTMWVMVRLGEPAIAAIDAFVINNFGGMTAIVTALYWLTRLVAWNAFWFVQGLNGTGLWVMAHECGHQAYSPHRSINDAVGMVLHSALLVPYHSWRISHGNHHKHTNHLSKDTVFIPKKSDNLLEVAGESPIVSLFWMLVTFTVGWPGYLIANAAGQDYGRRASHFEPSSPLFRIDEHNDVVASDIGIFGALGAIALAIHQFGFVNVWCYYFAPYLWVNFWLVFITYLQHTDIRLPHYTAEEWNFVRGALCTIDRDFGSWLNWWFHHINDSHVAHHIFSQMPFYNAIEVTRKVLPGILGEMYQTSNRSLWTSLWESWRECRYVVPKDGVAIYRH